MCFKTFSSVNEVTNHMDKKHSPDSFYKKLVEEISGACRKCSEKVSPTDIEDHFKNAHGDIYKPDEEKRKTPTLRWQPLMKTMIYLKWNNQM